MKLKNICCMGAAIIIALSIGSGCTSGGMSQDSGAPATAPTAFDTAQTAGTWATCPICGMLEKIAADTPGSEYHGKYYYFCSSACKDAFDTDPASNKVTAPSSFDQEMPEGTWVTCSVCTSGMEFQIDATRPVSLYNGKYYYFCRDACKTAFDADPETYINR